MSQRYLHKVSLHLSNNQVYVSMYDMFNNYVYFTIYENSETIKKSVVISSSLSRVYVFIQHQLSISAVQIIKYISIVKLYLIEICC